MAIIERVGGGGKISDVIPNFPKGYVMKSTALGDVFPGWSADIYPVCIEVSKSVSNSNPSTWSSHSANGYQTYNNKNALRAYANLTTPKSDTTLQGTATAYSLFLPYFYDFDWETMRTEVTSGTCNVWLEPK